MRNSIQLVRTFPIFFYTSGTFISIMFSDRVIQSSAGELKFKFLLLPGLDAFVTVSVGKICSIFLHVVHW